MRGCNESSGACNQAIMVITDGITKNLSDVIMKYNHLNGGSNIPVRLFTYLIGEEVTNINEILWIACHNRGSWLQCLFIDFSCVFYQDIIHMFSLWSKSQPRF